MHELAQHTVSPSVCAQFESFAQIAPRGCEPDAPMPPLLIDPPELVDPPELTDPPTLVDPPELIEPPIGTPVPPVDSPPVAVPEWPPSSEVESESSELHPTELETASRMDQGATALMNTRPNAADTSEKSMDRGMGVHFR